jgi:hypothetical protein
MIRAIFSIFLRVFLYRNDNLLFLQGWALQHECKISEELVYYEQAEAMDDKCVIFYLGCMDRYGQYMFCNINNTMKWDAFTLTDEEFGSLEKCYRGIDDMRWKFNFGVLYDIHKNNDQALEYLSMVAEKSYIPVVTYLGNYFRQHGDYTSTYKWFRIGTNRGDPKSKNCKGFCYCNGHGFCLL